MLQHLYTTISPTRIIYMPLCSNLRLRIPPWFPPLSLSQYFSLPLFSRGMWLVSVSIQRYVPMFSNQVILWCKLWITDLPAHPTSVHHSLIGLSKCGCMYLLSRLVLTVCTVLTQRSLKKLNVITALLLWCVLFYLKFTKLLCWGRYVNVHFFACFQSLMSLSMSHCLDFFS